MESFPSAQEPQASKAFIAAVILATIACFLLFCLAMPRSAFAADQQAENDRYVASALGSRDASQAGTQLEATGKAKTKTKKAQKIRLIQNEYRVAPGAHWFNLNARAKTKLIYWSSDPSVARVSSKGRVTVGKKPGVAIIYIHAVGTNTYKIAKTRVRVRVIKYRNASGMVVHSGSGHPTYDRFFSMGWNFIIRCKDPSVADHAAVAASYIAQNRYFAYNSRFPTSQENVDKRASIYKAIVKATGKNPSYEQLRRIKQVNTFASTSCTPTILSTYWLYYDMDTKISLKWRSPYDHRAYWYYCGAPNVEYHQLETAIRQVNKEYTKKGKIAPFQIIYIPPSQRSSFFSSSNIKKNLKRGDIVAACPNPNANGHTVMML